MTDIALPPPSPRDREVQAVALNLVEAYLFREARDVLSARLAEIDGARLSHVQALFLRWSALPETDRPDFLTYAHSRRRLALGAE